MQVEEVKISDIENHPNNPKVHNDNQIRLIEKSIKKFGYTNPVILSADGTILAGHARVKAAIQMGQDTIPCIRTKLTGKEADAYLIADNRLTELAQYDRDILSDLLSDLPKDLVDLTGFDTVQVDALLSGEDIPDIEKFISDSQPEEPREEVDAEPQIDRAAELNKKWQVKTGDLWQCGEHRIICGDCTDPAVVERVMRGEKAEIVITDPPYKHTHLGGEGFKYSAKIYHDGFVKSLCDFNPSWLLDQLPRLTDPCNLVVFCSRDLVPLYSEYAKTHGYVIDYHIWHKPNAIPFTSNTFKSDVEYIVLIYNKGRYMVQTHNQSDYSKVYTRPLLTNPETKCHPTEKPMELIIKYVTLLSHDSGIISDPFLGSGTTMIACENTGRKCRGIEISPEYCAVVLERFKEATGKEPVRING